MGAQPPVCDFGWKAPDFDLPGTDGKSLRLGFIDLPSFYVGNEGRNECGKPDQGRSTCDSGQHLLV